MAFDYFINQPSSKKFFPKISKPKSLCNSVNINEVIHNQSVQVQKTRK